MENNLYRTCPICHRTHGEILKSLHMCLQDGNPLPSQYDVVVCKNCGFAFADVQASQETYNIYYSSCNMYSQNAEVKKTMLFKSAVFEHIFNLIRDKILFDAKILDVGCGSGNLLRYLQQHGYKNLYGLDPSPDSIAELNENLVSAENRITGIVGNIFDPVDDLYRNDFDLVICTGVIEHIYDLNGYVDQIKVLMKESGNSYFLVCAPAVEGMPRVPYPIPNYFNHEHINYFSKISLDNLLSNSQLSRVNDDVYFQEDGELVLCGLYHQKEYKQSVVKDLSSAACVREYFEKIENKEAKNFIQDILKRNDRVILWGAGSYTMQLLAEYPNMINQVICFLDNNPTKCGKSILGKLVCLPSHVVLNNMTNPILICSMKNAKDIREQVVEMGLSNSVYIL